MILTELGLTCHAAASPYLLGDKLPADFPHKTAVEIVYRCDMRKLLTGLCVFGVDHTLRSSMVLPGDVTCSVLDGKRSGGEGLLRSLMMKQDVLHYVTHDARLIEATNMRLWVVEDRMVVEWGEPLRVAREPPGASKVFLQERLVNSRP